MNYHICPVHLSMTIEIWHLGGYNMKALVLEPGNVREVLKDLGFLAVTPWQPIPCECEVCEEERDKRQ